MALVKYGRIHQPRNDQRSDGAWRKIGYRVKKNAPAIGYCKVPHYGIEYDVWDSSQVEPIPGKKAQQRREAYHEYLFRRRMWDKRYAVAKHLKAGVVDYEIWMTDFVDDMALWSLGVLVCRPEKLEYIAQVVVADCRKSEKPDSPFDREGGWRYQQGIFDDPFAYENETVEPVINEAPETDDISF